MMVQYRKLDEEINHEMAVSYLNKYFIMIILTTPHYEIILLINLQRAYSSHISILIECGWAEWLPGH